MDKKYETKNRGAFFVESGSEVLESCNHEFHDGVKHYAKIIRSTGKDGKTKLEFCISLGMIYEVPEEEKLDPVKSPYCGRTFKLGKWRKSSESGMDYWSSSSTDVTEEPEAPF